MATDPHRSRTLGAVLRWTGPGRPCPGRRHRQAARDAAPSVRWVLLPFAGTERLAAAGVLRPDRTWTCVKGAYSEPKAEHALALAHTVLERARSTSRGRAEGRVRRFAPGEPLLGLVDLDAGY